MSGSVILKQLVVDPIKREVTAHEGHAVVRKVGEDLHFHGMVDGRDVHILSHPDGTSHIKHGKRDPAYHGKPTHVYAWKNGGMFCRTHEGMCEGLGDTEH